MQTELIAVSQYCSVHNIDSSFIHSLVDEGLISVTIVEGGTYIASEQLPDLEIYTRWHAEMGINTEGIDIINYLLGKIKTMQHDMELLQNKLHIYMHD
ncbi:MerR HTH family regulatory protein [Chitinophaga sp. CF118]|uniref:chaperone modulator CbpM n=1 Tax=Chitinophaga sp. CF118 TaxID=1884367 RepID=UPI0008E0673F|nr:chaperone modulator CbpM [Chitinophaga sp. CF118]SFD75798.1 MerR HTH family regulatory protein [Chitinophaga sp. CF118]